MQLTRILKSSRQFEKECDVTVRVQAVDDRDALHSIIPDKLALISNLRNRQRRLRSRTRCQQSA